MKNKTENQELPTVTIGEAIKMLNGLCEGLGNEVEHRFDYYFRQIKKGSKHSLSDFILFGFLWTHAESDVWLPITVMLQEIERGDGVKQ